MNSLVRDSEGWHGAWEGTISEPVQFRTKKPRADGLTFISLKGLGLAAVEDMLAIGSPFIDRAKLAFGTTLIYSRTFVLQLTSLLSNHDVDSNPGGTTGELALRQGRYSEFLATATELGFSTIEVSDGTFPMDDETRATCIRAAKAAGFKVVSEVGSKRVTEQLGIEETIRQIDRDLRLGVAGVIIEARASARGVGMFDDQGNIRASDVEAVAARFDPRLLTWEAPTPSGQLYFIQRFGPNANLGNIAPSDVISVEALRRGLRSDTLRDAYRTAE